MAHLSFLFTHWWDDSTFDWEYNTDYPKSFKVGSVIYRVYNMTEVSYQSTQGIQYGVSDHVLGLIYIILRDRSKDIPSSIRTQMFWHEYVHCLFVQANEDYANDIEYVVDAYATQICEFMRQFSKIKNQHIIMDKAFITVTPDTGQNNGTLSINADKNENYVSRYATFKVEGWEYY